MNSKKEALAELLNYIFEAEESNYEEILDEHGIGSDQANSHIYNLARNLWAEFEIDLP